MDSLQRFRRGQLALDKGREQDEQSCIWVEKGSFYGFGYIDQYSDVNSLSEVKESITRYNGNHYMKQLIYSYAEKFPKKIVHLKNE